MHSSSYPSPLPNPLDWQQGRSNPHTTAATVRKFLDFAKDLVKDARGLLGPSSSLPRCCPRIPVSWIPNSPRRADSRDSRQNKTEILPLVSLGRAQAVRLKAHRLCRRAPRRASRHRRGMPRGDARVWADRAVDRELGVGCAAAAGSAPLFPYVHQLVDGAVVNNGERVRDRYMDRLL